MPIGEILGGKTFEISELSGTSKCKISSSSSSFGKSADSGRIL